TPHWETSLHLPGPPTAFRVGDNALPDAVIWGSLPDRGGLLMVPPVASSRFAVVGPLPLAQESGPWVARPNEFWTSTESVLTIHDSTRAGFPALASTDFVLDPTIWPSKDRAHQPAARLVATDVGALALLRKQWVHLHRTAFGTIATDPWPLGAEEWVLDVAGNRVLVWDSEQLSYQGYQLHPDSAPVLLPALAWSGSHADKTGAWEVVDAALGPGNLFAAAEAFSGATLYNAGTIVDRVTDLQATAVAVVDEHTWLVAGESTDPSVAPAALLEVRRDGATVLTVPLPGAPRQLLAPEPGRTLALWDEGLSVIDESGHVETFAGRIEEVQLGAGWGIGAPGGELILRFTSQPGWWVVVVK
ncbi:MAG: hypothetical protein ABI743_05510, partial [bacterium]